tara:strand:+ start:53 stop:244 length:192 start_codon:yes stop_codon:yes gene_type:complete
MALEIEIVNKDGKVRKQIVSSSEGEARLAQTIMNTQLGITLTAPRAFKIAEKILTEWEMPHKK